MRHEIKEYYRDFLDITRLNASSLSIGRISEADTLLMNRSAFWLIKAFVKLKDLQLIERLKYNCFHDYNNYFNYMANPMRQRRQTMRFRLRSIQILKEYEDYQQKFNNDPHFS